VLLKVVFGASNVSGGLSQSCVMYSRFFLLSVLTQLDLNKKYENAYSVSVKFSSSCFSIKSVKLSNRFTDFTSGQIVIAGNGIL
jgi:hypothetical protein